MDQEQNANDPNAITLFAQTNFRNQQRRFGIRLDDRRRHMYVIGKTGMGKTTLLENMILSDIYAGHGCAYVDPHGDTAEKILDFIPSWRINDVVYFNPGDMEFPIGFNILETVNDEQKHLVGSGLMGVFKKIWPDVWSPRMEYILLNCVLALLDYPGATLLGINRLLVDKDYRQRVIEKIRDPIVKTFWVAEFSSWSEKYATEAIAPVQNKVGQFLSASIIRNILSQVKSSIDIRNIMDSRKIFIVNLSKGKIGEDNMRLLGNMLIVKMQLAAMERVDIPEADRKDFFLYVDEFQNFATPSFANILSEARKYRLALILAHQYIEQLDEAVRDAIFGNVGTILTFRVGSPDAMYMEKEFSPTFIPEDLSNLPKFGIYLKLMVDGVATEPFSASTLPPIAQRTGSEEKVVAVSRERYATPKSIIEDKVLKWSGMELGIPAPGGVAPENVINGGDVTHPELNIEALKQVMNTADEQVVQDDSDVSRESEVGSEGADKGSANDSGEYLRFSAERLAAIVKSQPQQKKEKPKFKHTCTRCGVVWEMPVQLDPTRPMYCADCLPLIREERKTQGKVVKGAVSGKLPEGVELEEIKDGDRDAKRENKEKKVDRLQMTMRAFEEGISGKKKQSEPNRPRIILSDTDKATDVLNEEDGGEDEEASELLDAIAAKRGSQPETHKKFAVPPKHEISKLDRAELNQDSRENGMPSASSDFSASMDGARKTSDQSSNRSFDASSESLQAQGSSKKKKRKRNRSNRSQSGSEAIKTHFQEQEKRDDKRMEERAEKRKEKDKSGHEDMIDRFSRVVRERDARGSGSSDRPEMPHRIDEREHSNDHKRSASKTQDEDAPMQTLFKKSVPEDGGFGGTRIQPGQTIRFDE